MAHFTMDFLYSFIARVIQIQMWQFLVIRCSAEMILVRVYRANRGPLNTHPPTSLLKQRSTNSTTPLCTTLPLAHSPTRPNTSHVFLQVAAAPLQLYSADPFAALSPPHLTPWLSYLGANRRTMWSWRDLRRSSH